MDPERQDLYRSRLQQARMDDRARLYEIDERPTDGSADTMEAGEAGEAERARATRQQEGQASLQEEASRRLAAIDHALERLDEGTYGTCEVCGVAIGEDRLEALPMTTRCREHVATGADAQ